MNDINLFETIQSEIDEIVISNNFNIDDIYNNIKLIAIEHSIDYYYNKASVEELIDIITESLPISYSNFLNSLDKVVRSGSYKDVLSFIKDNNVDYSKLDYSRAREIFDKIGANSLLSYRSSHDMVMFNKLKTISDIVLNDTKLEKFDSNLYNHLRETYKLLDFTIPTSTSTSTPISVPDTSPTSTSTSTPISVPDTSSISVPDTSNSISTANTSTFNISAQPNITSVAKDVGIDPQDHSTWWTLGKWALLISIIWVVFDRSKNSLTFVYYKYHIEKLLDYFKRNDYFSIKTTSKLLDYDYKFQTCSNYGKLKTPIVLTYSQNEYFKVRICFSKYMGSTFLYLMKIYKDYLKFKGINLASIKINTPNDLLLIRDERININIRESLFQMNKIINVFLDEHYKQKLLMLFKLTISDNFDINRFEFDDFK